MGFRLVPHNKCTGSRNFLLALVTILITLAASALGQDGTVKWTFSTGSNLTAPPAIGDDGTIYAIPFAGTLFAIQPDGTEKWRFEIEAGVLQPPAVADDGTVYVGNQPGKIYAVNPDGTQKWVFDPGLGTALSGEMAIAADGTLYAGIGGTVFAINPDGSLFWQFDAVTATAGITIGQDGVIFVTEANGELNALNPDGSVKWQVQGPGTTAPVIFGEGGTIYWGGISNAESFFALNPDDGSIIWQQALGVIRESASIGVNGDIYVPTSNNVLAENFLIAVDPTDGSEKWRFQVGARVESSPLVGFDGTIYFGTDTDELFALTPEGTQLWVLETNGNIRSSPTIAEDGTVYFGSDDDNLYAVESSSAGLAASSWPKKQRDVRNTGQFGSDVTRRRFFAPHVFWVGDSRAIVTISHIGGLAGNVSGTTANFRIDVVNRDGTVNFSLEDSVEPSTTKDIILEAPGGQDFVGSVVIDAPVKDGSFLAPSLTWLFDVSEVLEPLRIGVFFSDPTDAALVHQFPAESNETVGMGVAVQNIGDNEIQCTLEFYNADGTKESEVLLELAPLGSNVGFFDDSVQEGFKGQAAFLCDAPVVAIAVNQDFANGAFPTDRVTVKGIN